MFKFLVKRFISLLMDHVDTLHVGRYWSEVSCCAIITYLEVKVTDLENFVLKFLVKVFIRLYLLDM